MYLCIPVETDQGLESPVCAHFGSAPFFAFVDTEAGTVRCKPNGNQHHAHGMCRPLAALEGETVDAVVVGGIGPGALGKLLAARIAVYASGCDTVGETVTALKSGALAPVDPRNTCGHGHGHGGGHGHGHGGGCGH